MPLLGAGMSDERETCENAPQRHDEPKKSDRFCAFVFSCLHFAPPARPARAADANHRGHRAHRAKLFSVNSVFGGEIYLPDRPPSLTGFRSSLV
jgi:hypothetical protein